METSVQSYWRCLYLYSMSPSLESPIIVWVRWNEGMVVMGRRPATTAALLARLCSIQEQWLHLHCGQTLNLCYVRPSTFLLEDNRRIVVTVAAVTRSVCRRTGVGESLVCAREKERDFMSVQLCVFLSPSMLVPTLDLTPTPSKQTLECLPFKWGNVYQEINSHCFGYDWLISYRLLQETLLLIIVSGDRIKQWTRK